MTGQAIPDSLDKACHRFSKLVGENDYPEQILLVEQEGVVRDGRQYWVHATSNAAQERASTRYAEGIRQGSGMALYAFSALKGRAIEVIMLPTKKDEAERFLMTAGGLKLSAAINKFPARAIVSPFIWLLPSVRYRPRSRSFRANWLTCS